jgi:hypothetical protein
MLIKRKGIIPKGMTLVEFERLFLNEVAAE